MGARVARPASGEVVRAERLRSALEAGVPPAFIPRESTAWETDLLWKNRETAEARCHYLEQIFLTAPEGMTVVDGHNRALCVNQAFQTMFGYAPADLLGQTIETLIVPAEQQAEARWIAESVSRGESITIETQRKRRDGSCIAVSIRSAPLIAGGKCIGSYFVYRDLSEPNQPAAMNAANSEARYRSLVQSSKYGIYRSSVEGKFLDVNPALLAMLGYESADEVMQLDPQQDVFVNGEEHARLMEEFRRTGRVDAIEARWKRKNGSMITVRVSGKMGNGTDEAANVMEAIAEDVTERRALEEQFRQAQKMEAVGRLAGGVAHDFNNLLMVISGYAEVMLDAMDAAHPLHTKARAIQQASDRATTLTRQLLAFSRKQLLELKVVDVNAIIEDMERLLRPLIGENIDLVTDMAADAVHTRADAGQLEQVLMNLVVNSKDAMPDGGRIAIKTQNITLDDSHRGDKAFIRPGEYVMISVSDDGAGMDKETQSRIFEPFFTTKEKGKGTGLGLSTVYGIVKQSGGYVMVESEPECGTTFVIYLPRVGEAAEGRNAAPVGQAPVGGSETVLLVEDEESVRQLVRETLQSKGYRVLEAGNGDSGLAAAAQYDGTIDLVISDVVMPGMGGRELVQRLLESRPAIKVLYLSGYTEDAIVSDGTDESDKTFLQKPFTLQNLSRTVRDVLG
jgi:two-component system, cell cycle sensor histidine kinase and response regulator CckA